MLFLISHKEGNTTFND